MSKNITVFDKINKDITPDLVKKYHNYMAKTFDFKIIDKGNAPEMELVAEAVGFFTPISKDDFLRKYSTTLYNNVYIPYKIGEEWINSQLFNQICSITHEAQHVRDFIENPIDMISYLVSGACRAKIEGSALATKIYLQWWWNGKIPNLKKMAESLYFYGLSEKDQRVVYKHLRIHSSIAREGGVHGTYVMKASLDWLGRNCK
jgi:hypothetical protein